MCGLVGVMGSNLLDAHKKAFNDLLYLDVLRGEDSTGVAAISNVDKGKPEIEIFKSLGTPSELFYEHSKNTKYRTLTYKPVNIYIGHNRFATQGKITADNAHPFEFDNVVGAHNGTVDMTSLRDFHGYKEFDVDSQIIYSHLSHTQSIEDVWKNADGALALVWYDKVDNKLNMIRNSQRPLFVAYTADDRAIFWSSENWMIIAAAYRQNIKLHDVIEVKPNRLYTFDMVKDGTFAEKGRMFHTERDLPPFVAKPYIYKYPQNYGRGYSNGRSSWEDDYWDYFHGGKEKLENNNADTKPKNTTHNVRITEFHDLAIAPSAMGHLQDGKEIKINIPIAKYEEAKEHILNRTGGYYAVSKIHRSALNPDNYWCNWGDCQWVKLKPEFKVNVNDQGGFTIVKATLPTEYAPWFEPNQYLIRSAYETKVECGCSNCDRAAKWEDRNDVLWISNDMYFCKDCKNLPIVEDILKFAN